MYTAETSIGLCDGDSIKELIANIAAQAFEQERRSTPKINSVSYWDKDDLQWDMRGASINGINNDVKTELDSLWEDDESAREHENYLSSMDGRL